MFIYKTDTSITISISSAMYKMKSKLLLNNQHLKFNENRNLEIVSIFFTFICIVTEKNKTPSRNSETNYCLKNLLVTNDWEYKLLLNNVSKFA